MTTTPFGARSTALEVIAGHDLHGRDAIVTGGASGIGVETVRALATAGARVVLAARNREQAERVVADAEGRDRQAMRSPSNRSISRRSTPSGPSPRATWSPGGRSTS